MDPFAFLNRNLFLEIKDFQINHTHHHILYTYSHIFISQAVSINDEDETSNNINIQIYTFEKKNREHVSLNIWHVINNSFLTNRSTLTKHSK